MRRQLMRRSHSAVPISNSLGAVEGGGTHNGRNSEFLFLGVFEELENVIPDDDARLPAENAGGHVGDE